MDEEELEEIFVIERDSGDPDSEGRLAGNAQVREISPELGEQMKSFLKVLKKADATLVPDKRKRDEICGAVIREVLAVRLAQYPTTLEEDRALLSAPGLSSRKRMALEVRIGEKLLLQEAISFARSFGTPADEADGERSSKKARTD